MFKIFVIFLMNSGARVSSQKYCHFIFLCLCLRQGLKGGIGVNYFGQLYVGKSF